jgi:hypothetical protein
MLLPRIRRPDRQLRLFDADRLIKSDGERRWAVGDFYEQLTAEMTGAARLVTDSRATVCPDLKHSERIFFESKAVGKTGKVILYAGRQTRYREFTAAGFEIIHWIWSHNFRASNADSYSELNANLAQHTRRLFIVDFGFLLEFCGGPAQLINSQYNKARTGRPNGYHANELYGTGWMVPIKQIQTGCFRRSGLLAGGTFPIAGVEVFISRGEFGDYLK